MWWIPKTQIIHTNTVMIITPPHRGSLPFDATERHDAPDMEFTAFQPVVDNNEKTTTRLLPQNPNE